MQSKSELKIKSPFPNPKEGKKVSVITVDSKGEEFHVKTINDYPTVDKVIEVNKWKKPETNKPSEANSKSTPSRIFKKSIDLYKKWNQQKAKNTEKLGVNRLLTARNSTSKPNEHLKYHPKQLPKKKSVKDFHAGLDDKGSKACNFYVGRKSVIKELHNDNNTVLSEGSAQKVNLAKRLLQK